MTSFNLLARTEAGTVKMNYLQFPEKFQWPETEMKYTKNTANFPSKCNTSSFRRIIIYYSNHSPLPKGITLLSLRQRLLEIEVIVM